MNGIGGMIMMLLFMVLIFLICREVMCWYWKINEGIDLLKEIRNALIQNDGATPLMVASLNGHADRVKLLLAAGANVNATKDGSMPLMGASLKGHADVVKLLLAAGANVNAADKYGNTPLFYASKNGHDSVVQLLKAAGRTNRGARCGRMVFFSVFSSPCFFLRVLRASVVSLNLDLDSNRIKSHHGDMEDTEKETRRKQENHECRGRAGAWRRLRRLCLRWGGRGFQFRQGFEPVGGDF
jgi:hypothetical protein